MADDTGMRAILVESAERMLGELSTKAVVNAAEAGEWPAALWQAVHENGFPAAALPEARGGAGLGLSDGMALVRVLGRHAVPLPVGETIVAAWLLDRCGLPVPEGPLGLGTAVPAAQDPLRGLRLSRSQSGWLLSGPVRGIGWAGHVTRLVLAASSPEGAQLVSLDPAGLEWTASTSLAGEPRARCTLDAMPVAEADVRPLDLPLGGETVLLLGAALRAQQIAGACQAARDLAVRHAGDRIQFGQPLSRLPAVQQNLALLAGHAAAAGVAADMAVDAVESLLDPAGAEIAAMSVAMAKARAGEAAATVAGMAHQVHGAIGFTYEHTLHHFTRRLWAWRDEFGNESHWSGWLGARFVRAGDKAFWPLVTAASRLGAADHV